jgi:glycosyltransferase involved in cell wall biosynthesis
MPSPPRLSIIVAVYNKPEVLRVVLAAYAAQSFRNFELIVADDGSGPAVKEVLAGAAARLPIVHLWHEDRGWRKNTMLNNAIRAAHTAYLVFTDGDCIPSEHFVRDHWTNREPGKVLLGRRAEMSRRWSTSITLDMIRTGSYERYGMHEWMDGLKGTALRLEDGIRISSGFVRRLLLRNIRGMLGSNFSAWKEDLVSVNGFDELYRGPGCGEDSDIQYRLSLIGVTGKSLRNLAIQYHVYHPLTKPSAECIERFRLVQQQGQHRCSVGLDSIERGRDS